MATLVPRQHVESVPTDHILQPILRCTYGAPLPTIHECSERSGICHLPFETLAQIFLHLVQQYSNTSTDPFASKKAAVDLLNISHSCSYLRAVALDNPYPWSLVPFLDGISAQFIDAILTRSQPFDISLSFFERNAWPIDQQIWVSMSHNHRRIRSLHAQVAEGCDGRWLRALLHITNDLEDLSVRFHGDRYAPLIHRSPGQLTGLRSIYLINCFMPTCCGPYPALDHYHVEHTRSPHTQGPHSALSVRRFFRWREDFENLSSLTLHNAVYPFHQRNSPPFDPIELPHLELLELSGSLATCKLLGTALQIPSSCVRRVTIMFLACRRYMTIKHTQTAAAIVALFVDPYAVYDVFSISLNGGDLCVRLLESYEDSEGWDATFTFKTSQLSFPNPTGSLHRVLGILTFPIHGMFTLSPWDRFLLRLCDYLALALQDSLLFATRLILDMDHTPSRPNIIQPFLSVAKEISKVTVVSSRTWDDPCFPVMLDCYFGQFKELVVVLDSDLDIPCIQNLQDFVARRGRDELEVVEFGVTPRMVEEFGVSDDSVTAEIRTIAKDFPTSIWVSWSHWNTGARG